MTTRFFFAKYDTIDIGGGKKGFSATNLNAIRRFNAKHLIAHHSLLFNPNNHFHLKPEDALPFMQSHSSPYEALTTASEHSDRELNNQVAAHVNWFNYEKCRSFLFYSGFSEVHRSGFGSSILPVCRDTRYFDKTDPAMSLYIDAVA